MKKTEFLFVLDVIISMQQPQQPQIWVDRHEKDAQQLKTLTERGLAIKDARAIAYKHQYDYAKTPAGKDSRARYMASDKGKAAIQRAADKRKEKRSQMKLLKEEEKEINLDLLAANRKDRKVQKKKEKKREDKQRERRERRQQRKLVKLYGFDPDMDNRSTDEEF